MLIFLKKYVVKIYKYLINYKYYLEIKIEKSKEIQVKMYDSM